MSSSSASRCLSGVGDMRDAGIESPAVHSRGGPQRITIPGNGAQLKRSPAQVYALVFGVTLTLAGIIGFFYCADFSTGSAAVNDPANRGTVFGLFDVNGWSNVLLIVTGVIALSAAGAWFAARVVAWVLGIFYLALAIAGFAAGDGNSVLGLIPVNTAGSVFDAAVAAFGLLAALTTPSAPRPTLAPGRVDVEHVPALDHMP